MVRDALRREQHHRDHFCRRSDVRLERPVSVWYSCLALRIAWPFGAEQPYNAIHCSLTLNIAYELLEVRTGNSLKVYRTGKTHPGTVEDVRAEAAAVLDKAFGPDGEVKRKNILKLREAAEQAWAEGGPGRTAVEELLAGL